MKNVSKPEGKGGIETIERMNSHHTSVSLWSFEHLNIHEDDIILDVGCGGGINIKRLHELSPKAKTYGIDYSPLSVKMSKELNQEYVDKGEVIIKEADVQSLPFEDDTFDIVTACETVYFWPNVIDCFKEIRRVLKNEGIFVIILTTNGDPENHLEKMSKEFRIIAYNDEELKNMLIEAEFSEINVNIRQFEEKKELIKNYTTDNYEEIVVNDTFKYDDLGDKHHSSSEWLCVIAKK